MTIRQATGIIAHVGMSVAEVEQALIEATLKEMDIASASKVLKVNRKTIYNKIKQYGLVRQNRGVWARPQ